MRKAFTIVELMLVIGIIGILMGIVTAASSSAMTNARIQRAKALFRMVETGLATYYAQQGEWPVDFSGTRANNDGASGSSDTTKIVLTANEVRTCVQALVNETKNSNPLMDVSGLFVANRESDPSASGGYSRHISDPTKTVYGLDFTSAVRGTKRTPKYRTSQLYYGYMDPPTGRFLRFYMSYSIPADTISVGGWGGGL